MKIRISSNFLSWKRKETTHHYSKISEKVKMKMSVLYMQTPEQCARYLIKTKTLFNLRRKNVR